MPRNVEIKARVSNLEDIKTRAREISGDQGIVIEQEDTFFKVPNGRLKLRVTNSGDNNLIQYNRPDQDGPKLSDYHLSKVSDPASLKNVLSKALGVRGTVCKSRLLVMLGQTRVHLDKVKGLGEFMELEVVLRDDQTTEDGQKIAEDIMKQLNISKENLIECAYMDMILKDQL